MQARLFYNTVIWMSLFGFFTTTQAFASYLDESKHQINCLEFILDRTAHDKKVATYNYLSKLYRNIDYDITILYTNNALHHVYLFRQDKKINKLNLNPESRSINQLLLYVSAGLLAILLILILMLLKIRSQSLKQYRALQDKEQELNEVKLQKIKTEQTQTEKNIFAEQQISKLQREKLLVEIDFKNRELAQLTLGIINKNDVLLQIRELLKNDPAINGKNTNLYSYVSSNIDSNQNWYQFKKTFENTNPGFIDRLSRNYPDLTDNDIKLCAYLKLKLTSREIAQLMHITEAAISKSRNRLRKKVKLKPEEDLFDWLKSMRL